MAVSSAVFGHHRSTCATDEDTAIGLFLLKRFASFVVTLACRLAGRLRGARPAAGQRRRGDARRERHAARRSQALASKLGLDRPAPRALPRTGWAACSRCDLGQQPCLRHADRRADRASAWPSPCRWRCWRWLLTHGARAGRRRLRRVAPQPRRRPRRDGRQPARHRGAELLVRHPAGPAVRGEAALVPGRRLPRLDRRRRRRPVGRPARAAAAGDRAGGGAGRHPRAHHALGGARRAARGLRAHRARQGPVARAPCCGATCCATRWCRCSP